MPDDKRGARSPQASRPAVSAARPPPQAQSSQGRSSIPNLDPSDLPLPSDNRPPSFKLLGGLKGMLGEKLQELSESQLPDEQVIQFHRMAFGALAALLLLQAAAPTAVPSLWWAYVSQPLLLHFPSNALGGFWYAMGVALWLSYGAYHVTQGAILARTHSRWPWSPMRTLGMAMIPLYNVYGSWLLFREAIQSLSRESDQPSRSGQARSALLGAMALIGVTWGLQLGSDLGLTVPDGAIQAANWARAAAELATLGLIFSMMWVAIRKMAEEGSVELEEGESSHPLSRGSAGPPPGLTITVLVGLMVFGLAIYYGKREALECPLGASLSTTSIGSGERALYCAKDGIPEGPWRVRTKNGMEQFTYVGGKLSGGYSSFYASGAIKEQGSYNDKKQKTGNWTTFAEDGTKLEQATYQSDVIEGTAVKFFPNGQAREQRTFAGGKLNGKYVAFHDTGKKAEEGDYKDGNKVGRWTTWNSSGLVEEEKDYVAGKGVTATGGPQTAGTAVGATGGPPGPESPGPAVPVAPALPAREVTEQRFFAGRTMDWWEDRLTRIKQRVGAGELDAKVYELTKRRAKLNGLEVMDAQAQVKVRMAVAGSSPQGGRP